MNGPREGNVGKRINGTTEGNEVGEETPEHNLVGYYFLPFTQNNLYGQCEVS